MDAATPARRAVLAAGTSWGSGAGDSGPRGRVPHKDTLSGIRGRRGRGRCARARGSPPPGSRSRRRTRGGGWGWGGGWQGGGGEDEGPRGRRGAGGGQLGSAPGPRGGHFTSGAVPRPRRLCTSPTLGGFFSPPQPPSPLGDGEGGVPAPRRPGRAAGPVPRRGPTGQGRKGGVVRGGCGAPAAPAAGRGARGSGVRGLRGGAAGAGAQAAAGPWRRRDRGRGARRGEDGERAGSRYLYWAAAAAAAAPLWVNPK